jgi:hypothetical protein
MEEVGKKYNDLVNDLEKRLLSCEPVDCPLIHGFTPGIYTRTIFMPAGSLIVSKIHKTCHPYFILGGSAMVRVNEGEWKLLEAPWQGITEAGTRRVLYIVSDCTWTTVHTTSVMPKDGSDEEIQNVVDQIEERIIEKNPVLIEYKKRSLI